MPSGRIPDPKIAARNQEIARLIESGVRYADIAEKIGISLGNVKMVAMRQGVRSKLSCRDRSTPEQMQKKEQIWRLYNERVAVRVIAEEVRLSMKRVNDIINQHPDGAAFRANRGRNGHV